MKEPRPRSGTSPLAGEVGRGGAKPASLARKLRANPTAAEKQLWQILYQLRTGGHHFRKQHQIGTYVVDFICIRVGLIIEVDGHTHGSDLEQSNDAARTDYLEGRGFRVLRLTNEEVMEAPDGVFEVIAQAIGNQSAAPPSPTLPARGRVSANSVE